MNKKLFLFMSIMSITAWDAVSAKAQTNLIGTYSHQKKIDEGRNTLDLIFELKDLPYKYGIGEIYQKQN